MPSRTADSRTPNATPHPAQPRAARYLELLGRAAAHIDAHLNDPLDAETLADRSAMSRHHFHRIFRAYFGTTVGGYVTWRRLRRACELLADHPASVLAVAQAVGYESAQALAKAMRRELDTTPSAVRDGVPPALAAPVRAPPAVLRREPRGAERVPRNSSAAGMVRWP